MKAGCDDPDCICGGRGDQEDNSMAMITSSSVYYEYTLWLVKFEIEGVGHHSLNPLNFINKAIFFWVGDSLKQFIEFSNYSQIWL